MALWSDSQLFDSMQFDHHLQLFEARKRRGTNKKPWYKKPLTFIWWKEFFSPLAVCTRAHRIELWIVRPMWFQLLWNFWKLDFPLRLFFKLFLGSHGVEANGKKTTIDKPAAPAFDDDYWLRPSYLQCLLVSRWIFSTTSEVHKNKVDCSVFTQQINAT